MPAHLNIVRLIKRQTNQTHGCFKDDDFAFTYHLVCIRGLFETFEGAINF